MKLSSFKSAYQVGRLEMHPNIQDARVLTDANGVKHVSKRAYMLFRETDGSDKRVDLFGCTVTGATISEPLSITLVEQAVINGKLDGAKATELLKDAVIDIQVDESTGEFFPLIKRNSHVEGIEVFA